MGKHVFIGVVFLVLIAVTFSAKILAPSLRESPEKTSSEVFSEWEALRRQKPDPTEGLSEFVLDNGMKVILKKTYFEEDEVSFRVSAPGGFASLSPLKRPSGELSVNIGWESGVGNLSADQVSAFLYHHSVDMIPTIQPFARVIEGNTHAEEIAAALKIVNLLFTRPKFSQSAYKSTLAKFRRCIRLREDDSDKQYETTFMSVNTDHYPALKPLNSEGLEGVDFAIAKKYYLRTFAHPDEFTTVIVGDFDPSEVKALAEKYLGAISDRKDIKKGLPSLPPPTFPNGVTTKIVQVSNRQEALTRITMPLNVVLDEEKIHVLEFLTQVIETRLRDSIREKMQSTHGVDVSYEFPLYPFLDSPWMTIQFTSPYEKIKPLTDVILQQMRSLQKQGPSDEEIKTVISQMDKTDEFWLRSNDFWVGYLTNYSTWGWDPMTITRSANLNEFGQQALQEAMQAYFSTNNYTILIAKPK